MAKADIFHLVSTSDHYYFIKELHNNFLRLANIIYHFEHYRNGYSLLIMPHDKVNP